MRGSGSASTNCGTSMGNAGFCGPKHSSTVKPTENQESATMFCDICQAKFTLFNRKVSQIAIFVGLKFCFLKNLLARNNG